MGVFINIRLARGAMFSNQSLPSHHRDKCEGAPLLQMGQPAGAIAQRQQADDLSAWRSDIHGIDREVQFSDFAPGNVQAMG